MKTPQNRLVKTIVASKLKKNEAASESNKTPEKSKRSLGLSAYEQLRQALHSGEYGPGDRIFEDDIAKSLNISRTPVREALRRLEDEGFLVHESHRGITVARLDYQMIMELYAMRYVLEGAVAAMAARNASDIEIEMLRGLIKEEKIASKSAASMGEQNRRFHLAIYQCSHNRYMLKTLNILSYPLALLSKTAFMSPERRVTVCLEHEAIVDAISRNDPAAAEKAAHLHMRAAQMERMKILGALNEIQGAHS
jgi:DNA-binding GntR family transcriptional regulator